MTTSQKTPFLLAIEGDAPLSEGHKAYFKERVRNNYYDYVLRKFLEAEAGGLKKADLARRIGWRPDQLSRTLASPGNWTLNSITELLLGICKEELTPSSMQVLQRPQANFIQLDVLSEAAAPSSSSLSRVDFEPVVDGAKITDTSTSSISAG